MLTEVPEGWASKTVEDICRVFRGASPRPKGDPRFYGGSVPRLMVEDVSRDGKFVTPRVDSLTELGATKSRPVKAGSLVMVCSGVVGVPAIVDVDCCIHDGFLGFDDIDEECERDFLFYNFSRLKQQLDYAATHGGVFTNLTTSIVKEFQLLLPPLPEQRKIAEIMGSVDEAIRATEAVIEQTRRVKEGMLQELLTKGIGHTRFKKTPIGQIPEGWEVKRLGDIAGKSKYSCVGGPFGSNLTSRDYVEAGVPVIRGKNLGSQDQKFYGDDFVFVSERKADELHRNLAYPGDIVFTQRGTLGQVGLIPQDFPFSRLVVSQSQMKLTVNRDQISSIFVYHYMCSRSALDAIEERTIATGVPHINLDILRRFPIPVPSLSEQHKITDILERFDAAVGAERSKLESFRTLKQGLLQDLLTGKVRVSV